MAENTTCSVCLEMFKEPLSLSCVQNHWDQDQTRTCPLCRTEGKKLKVKFALKELNGFFTERLEVSEISQMEGGEERERAVASEKQQQLQAELQSLRAERQSYEELERTYQEMVQFSKKQAVQSERLIRAEFSRLQSFLQEEEQRALSVLREEQLRHTQNMGTELQEVRDKLRYLSNSIKELEEHVQTGSSSPQPQSPAPRLRPKAGLLLDQAKVLGNLGFRAWSNMRSIVSYSPVVLDPNSANRRLYLSEDLRGVRRGDEPQNVPDNPERFTRYSNVLGSEGFSSGTHQWDVEVGDHPDWTVGVTAESVDRKGAGPAAPERGVWALLFGRGEYSSGCGDSVPVETRPQTLRVKLDYDLGELSFFDAEHMTHLYTYSDSFSEKLFPFFSVGKAAEATELRVQTWDGSEEETLRLRQDNLRPSAGTKLPSLLKTLKDLFDD